MPLDGLQSRSARVLGPADQVSLPSSDITEVSRPVTPFESRRVPTPSAIVQVSGAVCVASVKRGDASRVRRRIDGASPRVDFGRPVIAESIGGIVSEDQTIVGSIRGIVSEDQTIAGSIRGIVSEDQTIAGSIRGIVSEDQTIAGCMTGGHLDTSDRAPS
jgi:acetamidase/formamidase